MSLSTLTHELELIRSCVRDVPDFPKPGILFKDITPLFQHPTARQIASRIIVDHFQSEKIDAVVAIEARGFLLGMLLAQELKVPFIPIRKAGKLPYAKRTASYNLEYGTASIEIHDDALEPGSRVLIHDDVLATGGTAAAAGALVQSLGGQLAGFSFIIDLTFLGGSINLNRQFGVHQHSLLTY
jgi:adenine phosphoribosyltransferase